MVAMFGYRNAYRALTALLVLGGCASSAPPPSVQRAHASEPHPLVAWARTLELGVEHTAVPDELGQGLLKLAAPATSLGQVRSVRWLRAFGSSACPWIALSYLVTLPPYDPEHETTRPILIGYALFACADGRLQRSDGLEINFGEGSERQPFDASSALPDMDGDGLDDAVVHFAYEPLYHGPYFEGLIVFGSATERLATVKLGDSNNDETSDTSCFVRPQSICAQRTADGTSLVVVQSLSGRSGITNKRSLFELELDARKQLVVRAISGNVIVSSLIAAQLDEVIAQQSMADRIVQPYEAELRITRCPADPVFKVDWPGFATTWGERLREPSRYALIEKLERLDPNAVPSMRTSRLSWPNAKRGVVLGARTFLEPTAVCANDAL